MATELKSLKGAKLKNVILSSNPCPICVDAAKQPPMTKTAWQKSRFGMTDSKKRYCNLTAHNCHCILVPTEMLDVLPPAGERIPLRGDRRTDIRSIIEVGPNERELQLLMDEYNLHIGQLPSEIYDMPLEDVADYLRGLLGSTPVAPPVLPGVTPARMATVKKAQKAIWEETADHGREYGVIYSRDGKYLLEKKGAKHSIEWSNSEVAKAKGGTLWHTHPSDTAFSFDDIAFAAAHNLKEIGVVGERHIYSMKAMITWGDVDVYSLRYEYLRKKTFYRAKYISYYNRLIAGGIEHELATNRANHFLFKDLWNDIANKYNLIFSMKRKGI